MAQPTPMVKAFYLSNDGLPLAGGKIYTYEAETTTPLVTYQDWNQSAENTNPVILDAAGRADIWLGDSSSYKIVVADANDVVLYTVDHVESANYPFIDLLALLASTASAAEGAGLIGYNPVLNYSINTVGSQLQSIAIDITNLQNSIVNVSGDLSSELLVYTTTGSGTAYNLTPNVAAASYATNQAFRVKFHANSGVNPTLNVSGLGPKQLMSYTSNGVKTPATIYLGTVAYVLYDGTDMIVPVITPASGTHGILKITSSGTFTVPDDVYSIKVTVVGGGGGSSGGWSAPDQFWGGGGGGGAASAISYIATTPGTVYSVVIGAGGIGQPQGVTGSPGGTTTFGSTLATASGGMGGTGPSFQGGEGGAGGSSGNDVLFVGGPGGGGSYTQVASLGIYGMGGVASMYSGAYGRGGAYGGTGLLASPGSGTPGVCVVEW